MTLYGLEVEIIDADENLIYYERFCDCERFKTYYKNFIRENQVSEVDSALLEIIDVNVLELLKNTGGEYKYEN